MTGSRGYILSVCSDALAVQVERELIRESEKQERLNAQAPLFFDMTATAVEYVVSIHYLLKPAILFMKSVMSALDIPYVPLNCLPVAESVVI